MKMKLIDRFESKIYYSIDGCWYWLGALNAKSYGRIIVNGVNKLAPRISYKLYKGAIRKGLFVCHTCDNSSCVNPDHLWLGTNKDNMLDMIKKGRSRHPACADHKNAKLDNLQVLVIKSILNDGTIQRKFLASYFKISYYTVSNIALKRAWLTLKQAA